MDSLVTVEIQEGRFIFREDIPTLKILAAFNVALSLCRSNIQKQNQQREIGKIVNQLNLPKEVGEVVVQSYRGIIRKIEDCLNYIHDFRYHYNEINNVLDCCVWKYNCVIDYEKTGRKIIAQTDLILTEKFKVMCTLCFQDEIENLVPDENLQQFIDKTLSYHPEDAFYEHPLVYYWICKMRNQLDWIPMYEYPGSLESFMIHQEYDHYIFRQYFWNFLDEFEQTNAAIELSLNLSNYVMWEQHRLLSWLNKRQLETVLLEIPGTLIKNFLVKGIYKSRFDAARLVWCQVKNSITINQFEQLIRDMLERFSGECASFVLEMWNTADHILQSHFLRRINEDNNIVKLFFKPINRYFVPCAIYVLPAILSCMSSNHRRDIILKHGDSLLVKNYNWPEISKIIEICLPNSNEMDQFKLLVQKSVVIRNWLDQLFRCGDFKKLIRFLKSYFPEESILKDVMKRILDVEEIQCPSFSFKSSELSELDMLLNIIYETDKASVIKVKKKVFSSFKYEWNSRRSYEYNAEILNNWNNAVQSLAGNVSEM